MQEQDIPSEIADIIVQSWRPGTSRKYDVYVSKWVQFCSERNFSPYEATINQVLLFLYDLFQSGVEYSVMNTARSSLSTFIIIDGVRVGQHPVITRFMKGVFNIKPALPKYNFIWDVGIVITYISKIDTYSLTYLSQKLATLLVLLCGQRCGEILSVLDIRNLDLSENMCVIRIGDILKTSGPKNHIGEIKFHSYPNDLTICPLNCLRQYLEARKPHRGNITSLFTILNKPFKEQSKDTLVRWVKQTLKDAGINMNIFSPHSTRSASNCKEKISVPLKTILETVGWRSNRTFARFYNKPILQEEQYCFSILKSKK